MRLHRRCRRNTLHFSTGGGDGRRDGPTLALLAVFVEGALDGVVVGGFEVGEEAFVAHF